MYFTTYGCFVHWPTPLTDFSSPLLLSSTPPVTNKHHFVDGPLLFQFRMNFRRRRRLLELLQERILRENLDSLDSPFCLRKQNPEAGNTSFLSGDQQSPRSHDHLSTWLAAFTVFDNKMCVLLSAAPCSCCVSVSSEPIQGDPDGGGGPTEQPEQQLWQQRLLQQQPHPQQQPPSSV